MARKFFLAGVAGVRKSTEKKPFEITIGEIKIIEQTVQVFWREIEINGVVIDGEPHTLADFFEALLEQGQPMGQGLILKGEDKFLKQILKSRVAYQIPSGEIFPTTEFKNIARDFLKSLTQTNPTFAHAQT